MRKTKIIGTIGPASNDYTMLKKLVLAGLNIVRVNLSHATQPELDKIFDNVKRLRKELNIPLPIMLDTRGPEIRVKTFEKDEAEIKKGQQFIFTARDIIGNKNEVSFNIPEIVKCIKPGNKILAVNGLITFKVLQVTNQDVITKALNSGVIGNRKSLSIPGVQYSVEYLNEADKKNILWGIENGADFVAASFVNSKDDVLTMRKFIQDNNGSMKIISKIESVCGVRALNEIIDVSDGVMVARGDLGVEFPAERLPILQKEMIKTTRERGKFVITATEMLESMITNNRPTRAEASDVANAVYDGTSCVMLSGETAMGKFPIEAVKQMAKIAHAAEKDIHYSKRFATASYKLDNITDVISHSAVNASFMQNTKAIVVFTHSGQSAMMVSRFRPENTILGATPNEQVYRQLEIMWGVKPMHTPVYKTTDKMFDIANEYVKKAHLATVGDTIVVTSGLPSQQGGTSLIKIGTVI